MAGQGINDISGEVSSPPPSIDVVQGSSLGSQMYLVGALHSSGLAWCITLQGKGLHSGLLGMRGMLYW